jgi:DMSO reductase anchor subunit
LSNEIAAGVVFLGIAGLYWMTSFSQKNNGEGGGASQYNAEDATSQSGTKHASSSVNNPLRMRKIAAVLMILSGVAFLFFISRAYSTETIISWNNSIISLTPILYALMIGPLLTVAVMFAADRYAVKNVQGDIKLEVVASKEICVGLFVVSIVFFVLSATAFVLQYLALGQISNSIGSAYERIPQFIYLLCVFVLLCVIALAIEAHCVFKNSHSPQVMSIAYLIMSAGIFVMRFAFYMSYTTVGISL